MTQKKSETPFPYSIYGILGQMLVNQQVQAKIIRDQQLYSAFCVMSTKFILNHSFVQDYEVDSKQLIESLSSIGSKSFTIDQLSNSSSLIEDLKKVFGSHLTSEYTGGFLAYCDSYNTVTKSKPYRFINLIDSIGQGLIDRSHKTREKFFVGSTQIEHNIELITSIFDFNLAERHLIEHASMLVFDYEVYVFLRLFSLTCRKNEFEDLIQSSLSSYLYNSNIDDSELLARRSMNFETSKPLIFNILKINHSEIKQISQFWQSVIFYDHRQGMDGFNRLFIKPMKSDGNYSSVIARLNEKMIPVVKDLLNAYSIINPINGLNLLLYGPSSLDKDQALLRALGTDHEYEIYEMNNEKVEWGDEASIAYAAQQILEIKTLEEDKIHLLLVRDAASTLSKGVRPFSFKDMLSDDEPEESVELSSDEYLLSKSTTPTIWYANSVSQLSEEAVGKFLLHLQVYPGTRHDRKMEVEKIADSLNLPAEVRTALSKYTRLGANQVKTAAHVTNLLKIQPPDSHEMLLQLVEEGQKALSRSNVEEIRTSVTKYSLDLLNIHSRFTPDQVIKALKKKPSGTLCFYGLPGTGKTQLAEYIATELDKPLMIKRASDLMSKWVGDNEKNIAEMFQEAKAEGSILLLDEADSFLRDRALAKSGWEVTMVNELLQQMERFPGIFICASNLFSQLDAASIRRFTFKFNFQALSDFQRIKMFENETGVKIDESHKMYEELMMIQHLTPGDFATVKRQSIMLDQTLTPEDWLVQLNEEAKAKTSGLERNFTQTELQ